MFSKFLSIFSFSNLTLLVALTLSTIAAWYSIVGLTAIFAAAVIPIIIMGSALELAKIVTTVWLRKYWHRCTWIMKVYLVPAVVSLAVLTSMGIFGFLSKAHSDQSLVSGDVLSKIAIYDEKIKNQKDNIEANRKALKQMDEGVDSVLGRSTDEKGADKAVALRKAQQKERVRLQAEILQSQKSIAELNEARAPIAAEVRKVEAEVGPIKYIAAFIYGDNPDANLLERAVRWVIILLVIVFDPLAIMLVIAANQSKDWDKDVEEENLLKEKVQHQKVMDELNSQLEPEVKNYEQDDGPLTEEQLDQLQQSLEISNKEQEVIAEEQIVEDEIPFTEVKEEKQNVTFNEQQIEQLKELIKSLSQPEKPDYSDIEIVQVHPKQDEIVDEVIEEPIEEKIDDTPPYEGVKDPVTGEWTQTGPSFPVTNQPAFNVKFDGDYAEYKGKRLHKRVLYDQYPELRLEEDKLRSPSTRFGTEFPSNKMLGDLFVRVDVTPNRIYKYNGAKWIETGKNVSSTYLSNPEYIQFLINKIASGEYDMDLLTVDEQDAVEKQLRNG